MGGQVKKWGRFKLRDKDDDLPQSWWFASTAIPLLAATIGPLANLLSIAGLVSKWRVKLPNNGKLPEGADDNGITIQDPEWEIILNGLSLAFGFIGNFFLLCNFTRRVRYIIALPATVILWFLSSAILISIIVAMSILNPPIRPGETWSQGFWHAIIACVLYNLGFGMLLINMVGYLLGKYPQNFYLTEYQRTLILQTMMFFIWLGGGAAVFMKVCGFSFTNALYYCDVTILTVGFGDIVPTNNVGRGIAIPYALLGIVFLGLVINSIHKFAKGISRNKIVKAHEERVRADTVSRSVTNDLQLRDRLGLPPSKHQDGKTRKPRSARSVSEESIAQYGELDISGRVVTFTPKDGVTTGASHGNHNHRHALKSATSKMPIPLNGPGQVFKNGPEALVDGHQRLLYLKDEKDRFDAMRDVQENTKRFKQYYKLSMSILAFAIVWFIGAIVFWVAEDREQGMSYFEALYFCYVSLLTIGYGDYSPKSNAGKAFFVFWSLVAVPVVTILISDMSDTVISGINHWTNTLADWTIMPRAGVLREFLDSHPRVKAWVERKQQKKEEEERIERGFVVQNEDEEAGEPAADAVKNPTMEKFIHEGMSSHEILRRLALAIKKAAQDMQVTPPKRYSYEEWAEFTRLIRFTAESREELREEEEEEGLINWDWIGEDSPMLADMPEPEWVLNRLIESINRYTAKQQQKDRRGKRADGKEQDGYHTPPERNLGNERGGGSGDKSDPIENEAEAIVDTGHGARNDEEEGSASTNIDTEDYALPKKDKI
ncbi:hypothetical protein V495_07802 [Pseudogymnoascus sp. VKM F-4514 (FW-929)]|nr:hypothetical protein V495_07802 [Pseudogymnoascus sp. VKM F-4514 (FW-929)]KFY57505.1 hypothetical protein V497_05509 [Pseudogymnoascus sp. VKM F-4516 (FW-969)]